MIQEPLTQGATLFKVVGVKLERVLASQTWFGRTLPLSAADQYNKAVLGPASANNLQKFQEPLPEIICINHTEV